MYLSVILIFVLSAYMIYLVAQPSPDPDIIQRLRKKLAPVDTLFLTIPIYSGSESFTNKEVIYLCTKDNKNRYYNDNTLIRVLLHEMAHVRLNFVDSEHTSPEFKRLEDKYISKATTLGIYNPLLPFPCNYCGSHYRRNCTIIN